MELAVKFFDVKKKKRDSESVEFIKELRKKVENKFEEIDSIENIFTYNVSQTVLKLFWWFNFFNMI